MSVTSERRRGRVRSAPADLAFAFTFLTVVPVRGASHGTMGRAAAWFPVVGALVGVLAGLTRVATAGLFGAFVATVLALAGLVALTGALHIDGLADTADGLGVRTGRERRLAAMRDSATGVFGALALIAWSLLMLGALSPLDEVDALRALVVAGAASRWAALLHARATSPARSDGLGAVFHPDGSSIAFATLVALAIAIPTADPLPGLAAAGAAAVVGVLSAALARRTLGGRTGDTLGAAIALAELAVVLTLFA